MKKHSEKSNNVVTKKYVDKKFDETKEYVDKRFERLFKYLDHRFEPLESMAKEFSEFKERIYSLIDRVLGRYEKLDQESTIASHQYTETVQQLKNHEIRITTLEKKSAYKTS